MTQQEVIDLMRSSKNAKEWDANCDKVKKACNGYPDFWFLAIVLSGVFNQVKSTW